MSASSPLACHYCGLPVAQPLWRSRKTALSDSQPYFCCYGCQFAASVAGATGDEGAARWTLTRLGLAIFLTMNVMVCSMALWSFDVYAVDDAQGLSASWAALLRSCALLLSAGVLLLLGQPIASSALQSLRRGVLATDLLVMTGVIAAYGYSVTSVLRGDGQTYFEVGCMVLVMITLGRWLEATSRIRATTALDRLQRLLPENVVVERDGAQLTVPLSDVRIGDAIIVRPGERFPTDGRVVAGETSVDEHLITGESWPTVKQPRQAVMGGTLNLDAPVTITVAVPPSEGTLARLIDAVREARLSQGYYQRLTDRIAGGFFPLMALIAIVTLVAHGLGTGWGAGLMAALSVVLVACPCALGLATPLAVWCSLDRAATNQVLFRSGEAIEQLAGARAVRLDKTGTLTTGEARILSVHADPTTSTADVRFRAAALAETSTHVFARAIAASARDGSQSPALVHSRHVPGLGIVGDLQGEAGPTLLGSERLMQRHAFRMPANLRSTLDQEETAGRAVTLIGWAGRVQGVFVFEETLRAEACAAIEQCRGLMLDVGVLTGDHDGRGRRVAALLDVRVEAGLLPEDKLTSVRKAQQRIGPVVMVGDGVNDAPALTAADVGIAMGCGPDLTRDAADVCLMSDDLLRIPWAIEHARRTIGTIRRNLAWAFGYNSLGVAVAASGWLHPIFAAALMLVSSVVVIGNSLRLRGPDVNEPADHRLENSQQSSADAPTSVDSHAADADDSPPPSLRASVKEVDA